MRLALLVLSLLTVHFGSAKQNGAAGQRNKTGEVQGSVVDATTNQPVHSAVVILRKFEDSGVGTYTDATGKFAFRDIDPGTYTISAEHDGFAADPKEERRSVTVTAGVLKDAGTLKLNRTGAVSGRVTDPSGEAMSGANIQLQPWKAKKNQPSPVSYATSDDRGNYRAYNIPPGKYKLAVTYSPVRTHSEVKMQLENEKSKNPPPETYATTYYPGTLDPGQAAAIQVDSAADLQGVDIRMLPTKAVRITGRVTGPDAPLPGPLVMVMLRSVSGNNSFNSQMRGDGSFEFIQIPPGKYILTAIGMLEPGQQIAAQQPVEVGETDVNDVQLTLLHEQIVTGKVIMPPGRKVPQDLIVALQPREQLNALVLSSGAGGLAQVHEDGAFSIDGVNPGEYDLVLGNAGKGDDLYVDGIRSGDQDIFSSGFHIGATTSPPVEIVLKPNGAEIDCTVLDAKATPVPDAQVTLLPDPPRSSQLALRGDCRTDAEGKCVLLGIAPGNYHAFAFAKEDQIDFRDPEIKASLEKAGTPVTVAIGDQKPVQLKLLELEQQ